MPVVDYQQKLMEAETAGDMELVGYYKKKLLDHAKQNQSYTPSGKTTSQTPVGASQAPATAGSSYSNNKTYAPSGGTTYTGAPKPWELDPNIPNTEVFTLPGVNSTYNAPASTFTPPKPTQTPSTPAPTQPAYSPAPPVEQPQGQQQQQQATAQQQQPTQQTQQAPQQQQAPQMSPEVQQQQVQSVQAVTDVMAGFAQLYSDAARMGNEGLAAMAAQYEQMVQMIDNMQSQITQQFKAQMNSEDPAMQAAIGLIKEEAQRMRDASVEELNSRGLVQSGIYAKTISDMNRNELTQIQQTVSQRFGDLQNQLNAAIMSLAQTRIGALSNHQSSMNQMLMNNQSTLNNIGLAGMNAQLTQRGQDIQNQQYYSGLQQDQGQFDRALSSEEERFYVGLNENTKQFYAGLSSQERMQYAQLATQVGIAAAQNALEDRRIQEGARQFDQSQQQSANQFEQSMSQNNDQYYAGLERDYYSTDAQQSANQGQLDLQRDRYETENQQWETSRQDALDANEQQQAYEQITTAENGGQIQIYMNDLKSGRVKWPDLVNLIQMIYTPKAAEFIIKKIQSDPSIKQYTDPAGMVLPQNSLPQYTPAGNQQNNMPIPGGSGGGVNQLRSYTVDSFMERLLQGR